MDKILLLIEYIQEYRSIKEVFTTASMKRKKELESKIDVFTYLIKREIEDGKIK